MDSGPWILLGTGPYAGSSAGQQRAGILVPRGSLDHFTAMGLGARVDEAEALMAKQKVLMG